MPGPRVSVLITTWNGARFLAPALASVLAQTCRDFELIVVDDGSSDATPEILAGIRDPRVRVLRQENRGPVAALDAALAVARAPYLGFLDHDDVWLPAKLERHLAALDAPPGPAITFSWSSLIDENGRAIGLHPRHWLGPIGFAELLGDFVIGNTSSVVMRRDALERAGGLDPAFRRYYDMDLFLRVALAGERIEAVPEELTHYRRHATQMSRDVAAMAEEWSRLLAKLEARAPRELPPVRALADSNMRRYFAYLAYEADAFGEALAQLAAGARGAPLRFASDPRNWALSAAVCAGIVLPAALHARLERLAGIRRRAEAPLPGQLPGQQRAAKRGQLVRGDEP